jgi:cytochrome c-type biogenesis protein CcmF
VGPLLPWRATSFKAVKRNFILPAIALWATVIVCVAAGVRPWQDGSLDTGSFYAMVGFALAAAVLTAIVAEFLRGAGVISRQTGRNLFAALWLLTRRNTRRYGGYLIHIGVVIVVVGLCGSAFNRNQESELGLHGKLNIGPYTLEQVGATQDSNLNYNSEYALLNVSKGNGKTLFQMTPEKRFYLASGQPQTMVAIHSVPEWDLYVVYEGTNPDTGQPIIKAFLNPLVGWIWAGLVVIVLGTFIALVPSLSPATATLRVPAARPVAAEPAVKGGH